MHDAYDNLESLLVELGDAVSDPPEEGAEANIENVRRLVEEIKTITDKLTPADFEAAYLNEVL